MSSINPHYTLEYSQHDDYRFSHDSVFLARQAFELTVKNDFNKTQVLDLCSGCGIVGLDFLFHRFKHHLPLPQTVDFLEVQEIYREHFAANTVRFKKATNRNLDLHFINRNYEELQNKDYKEKYNLILCNPPYFRTDQGTLSQSHFKNRCRFYMDSSFENLIKSLENCTAPRAQVYILLKSLEHHGINIQNEILQTTNQFSLNKIGLIRGTDFWLLTKKEL